MDHAYSIYNEILSHFDGCSRLSVVGFLATLTLCIILFNCLFWTPFKLYFLAQILPTVDLRKFGKWAVITGSTDGIGKGYARVMASKGLNIVLVSRSAAKLSKVAEEINAEYGVEVKTITADFTQTDIYDRIQDGLEGLDIAILVNNVAIGSKISTFLKTENIMRTAQDIANVNCVAITKMCALVLPQMVEKNKGVVVNFSSIAGARGFIGTAIYSASKAYVSMLSNCLQQTYKRSGILIQTVEPGLVLTNMMENVSDGSSPKELSMAKRYTSVTVEAFVQSAVNTIGWAERCNGHIYHYFVDLLAGVQGTSANNSILSQIE